MTLSSSLATSSSSSDARGAGTDAIIRGLVSKSSQRMDSFFSRQLTQHLFTDRPPAGAGEDIASLTIQIAMDYGIPGVPQVMVFRYISNTRYSIID